MSPVEDPPTLPLASRIRSARDLRGKTQAEVVRQMGDTLTAAGLSQIESGKVTPTEATVSRIADALEVPVEFFASHWSALDENEDPPEIYFRDLRSTPSRERRRARAMATLVRDLAQVIEQSARLPAVDLPRVDVAPEASRSEIEQVAVHVRRSWSLGTDPIRHVVREIERHGVPVARLTMGHEKIDAFALAFRTRPIIFLSNDKNDNYVRSRLDASHELGHLVMHRKRGEQDRSVEPQAHAFAASFLYPAEMAEKELPRRIDSNSWRILAGLKQKWGLSMAALIRRGKDLELIDEDEYRNAMRFMSARGWRKTEPGDRELGAAESPLLLERAVRTVEVEHNITFEELVRAAHLPLQDVTDLISASTDTRPVVEF